MLAVQSQRRGGRLGAMSHLELELELEGQPTEDGIRHLVPGTPGHGRREPASNPFCVDPEDP